MKRLTLAGGLSLVLAGCQSASPPADCMTPPSPDMQKQVSALQSHTALLQANGAINTRTFNLPATVTANSDRLTLQWDGDAVELLNHLARQRGLEFVYTGTRLPLPVDVNVRNMTFQNLLDLVRAQTGWRATLTQTGVMLRLDFTLPQRRERLT